MRAHRVVMSGICVAIVALALSGCGTSPAQPTAPVVSSPYLGSSAARVDPISGIGIQQARVQLCSLAGGPLRVHVSSPGANTGTQLTVRAISTDLESTGDVVDATLVEQTVARGTVTIDTHVESNRAMMPNECAVVTLVSNDDFFAAGDPFSFTVTW
jgi:hypothetical protein